jgi:hypothetical protein
MRVQVQVAFVIALAAIALAVGLGYRSLNPSSETVPRLSPENSLAVARATHAAEFNGITDSTPTQSDSQVKMPGGSQSVVAADFNATATSSHSGPPSAEHTERKITDTESPSSVNPDDLYPQSVVGRPFPVSESIEAICKRYSTPTKDDCAEEHQLMEKMAQEPRDPKWASGLEAKLRQEVLATGPGKYDVRAIECRSTLCALEVQSKFGIYISKYETHLWHDELFIGPSLIGYERDEGGNRITVYLRFYTRR